MTKSKDEQDITNSNVDEQEKYEMGKAKRFYYINTDKIDMNEREKKQKKRRSIIWQKTQFLLRSR